MVASIHSAVESEISQRASLLKKPKGTMLVEQLPKLNKDLFLKATTMNPFFSAIANDQAPPKTMLCWMAQHRIHIRLGFIKLLGYALTKVTTIDERNWPHEQESLDVLADAVKSIHALSDFLGHIMLELEDESDVGEDMDLGLDGEKSTLELSGPNNNSIDFLIAVGANGTLPECLVVIWSIATLYYSGWENIKYKMISRGAYTESEPQSPSDEHRSHYFPNQLGVKEDLPTKEDKASAGLEGLFDSSLTPTQKMVAHWTSPRFATFIARLAGNIEGYTELNQISVEHASHLFKRTIALEAAVWPEMS